MEGIVTQSKNICFICGKEADAEHHLIFGTAGRELSEKDGLKCPVCNNCHNMGDKLRRIHDNPMAEKLSKMVGQLAWEKEWILNDTIHDSDGYDLEKQIARNEFRKRYGMSYL